MNEGKFGRDMLLFARLVEQLRQLGAGAEFVSTLTESQFVLRHAVQLAARLKQELGQAREQLAQAVNANIRCSHVGTYEILDPGIPLSTLLGVQGESFCTYEISLFDHAWARESCDHCARTIAFTHIDLIARMKEEGWRVASVRELMMFLSIYQGVNKKRGVGFASLASFPVNQERIYCGNEGSLLYKSVTIAGSAFKINPYESLPADALIAFSKVA